MGYQTTFVATSDPADPNSTPKIVFFERDLSNVPGARPAGITEPLGPHPNEDGELISISIDSKVIETPENRSAVLLHEYIHARRRINEEKINADPPETPSDSEGPFGERSSCNACEEAATYCINIRALFEIMNECDCYGATGTEGDADCGPSCTFLGRERDWALDFAGRCAAKLLDSGVPPADIPNHPDYTRCNPPSFPGCPE